MNVEGPVFPRAAQPLKTLTAVMAVMCFLAVLAVGALIMINRAVEQWSRGLASEVTVQVKQATGRDVDADVASAIALLTETKGIVSATAMSRADAEKLLEPWLGSEGLDKLPVPALIRVVVAQDPAPDFEALSLSLKEKVPVAQLDTHRRWEAELRRMAGTLSWLSWLVLLLVGLSAALIVASASRAVLASQSAIVEALIMAGAEDRFIADAVGRRFIWAGLGAGLIGLAAGLAVFAGLGFFSSGYEGVAQAARGLFHMPQGDQRLALISFAAIPVAATVIALIASRLALGQTAAEACVTLVLRSLVFNVLFYVVLVLYLVLGSWLLLCPRPWAMAALKHWGATSVWLLKIICGTQMEVRGLEHIPKGAVLVAGKHQSFWETFAILLLLDDPCMVLKRELLYIPLFGWFGKKFRMIGVERSAGPQALRQMVKRAKEEVEAGRQIVIMPEGTRKTPGDPPDYKPGAAALYGQLNVPCVPFGLNAGLFWPRRKFLRHPGTIIIEFTPAIPAGLKRQEFQQRLEQAIESTTNRLLVETKQN